MGMLFAHATRYPLPLILHSPYIALEEPYRAFLTRCNAFSPSFTFTPNRLYKIC